MKKIFLILLLAISVGSFAQTSVPRYELITASGTNTYAATVSPTPSLQNGFKVAIKFTNENSGASTLNVSGTGAITLRRADGTALSSGDIPAGSDWWVIYDGTTSQWRLLGGGGSGTGLVDADYTDITVSGTGTVMTIDNNAVTDSKINDVAVGKVTGLGTGVGTALTVNVGSAGAPVVNGGALGTPSSGTLTSATGLPISTGVSGLGTGVATLLGTPSSANLAAAITDETGTGAVVLANTPTLTNPIVGTQAISDNTTAAASTAFVQRLVIYAIPEIYGAVGDGVTNDAVAVQAAENSGLKVFFGAKSYLINTTVNFSDSEGALGCGNLTIIKTTANITIFNVQGQQISFENMTFQGDASGSSQRGIAAVGNAGLTLNYIGNRIVNCRFVNFGSAGVYAKDIVGSSSGGNHEGAFILDVVIFSGCTNAIFWDTRAEYNIATNFKAYNCTTAVRNLGGNNSFSQFHITGCTTAWLMNTGTNDGHSVAGPGEMTHNTTNLNIDNTTNGYLFLGVMFYAGNISISNSTAIRFNSCEFGGTLTITINASGGTQFDRCRFVTAPTWSITSSGVLIRGEAGLLPVTTNQSLKYEQSEVLFANRGASGTVNLTLPSPVTSMTYTFYVDAAQSLTVVASGGATIRDAGTVGAANGNITSNTVGSFVKLYAISATEWVVVQKEGSWTVN